jgi:FkbM family methyltransferase
MQNESKLIEITNGVLISTPTSLRSITSYVLEEQGDWFEDEIRFVRQLLVAGDCAIDIGANQGVYTLSMANIVGPGGKVWAFEPTNSTAVFLANGIQANGFGQVTLVNKALSNYCGKANFNIFENSEMNSLTQTFGQDLPTQEVDVITMDVCSQAYDWSAVKFIKIDAEGEERNILQGGQAFFTENSPLIMCENPNTDHAETPIFTDFAAMGYLPYRLVSGLNCLIPVCPELPPDKYIFNIFFCKPDRAAQLAAAGLLVVTMPAVARPDPQTSAASAEFSAYFSGLPYAENMLEGWKVGAEVDDPRVAQALALFLASQKAGTAISDRFSALWGAYLLLREVCDSKPAFLRLFSLARVANALGAREESLLALHRLLGAIQQDSQLPLGLNEPFLAPLGTFEQVRVKPEDAKNWVLAALLEAIEKLRHHSSCYAEVSDMLLRLRLIRSLGYGSPEMARRISLVERVHSIVV